MIRVVALAPQWRALLGVCFAAVGAGIAQGDLANGAVVYIVVPLPNPNNVPLDNLNFYVLFVHYKLSLWTINFRNFLL